METYKNLKKGTKVGLILSLLFIALSIGVSIFSLIPIFTVSPMNIHEIISCCAILIMSIFVLCYAVFGYKKPHGNMLRTVFLTFSILTVYASISFASHNNTSMIVSFGLIFACSASVIVGFVAGRLNKIEKNKKLLALSLLLLIANTVVINISMPDFMIAAVVASSIPALILFALIFAYVARYEEHKAAGLED